MSGSRGKCQKVHGLSPMVDLINVVVVVGP